jgi:putative DNA primase/helicase
MSYVEILKNKHQVVAINEKIAKDIFNNLEEVNKIKTESFYGKSKDGKLIYFYPQILAEKILQGKHIINVTGHEKDTLLYKDGVYKITNDLRDEINKNLNYKDPRPELNRVNTLKEIRERGIKKSSEINKYENLINFKNGMYDIEKRQIIKHSKDYYSTIQINFDYKKDLHKEKDMSKTLFGHLIKYSLDSDQIKILQEIFGYCLCLSVEAQKFFIFSGKAKNGKSQLLKILSSLFDSRFVSSLELKHFQDDVRVYSLYNKLLNICSDISSEYIKDDSLLKRATGEDSIHCNPKFRDGFDFYNRAKLIFSCNELPNIADKTQGFMRRLIIVPFDKVVSEKNKISSIGKLISMDKSEMEIIVSWAIEGLHRLIENNWKFSEVGRIKEAKEQFELENNNVKKFIYNCCSIDRESNNFVICSEFKDVYEKYCILEGLTKLSYKNMKITIESLNLVKKKNTLHKGWYYEGLSFNEEVKDFYQNTLLSTIDMNEKQYIKSEQEGKQIDLDEFNFQ